MALTDGKLWCLLIDHDRKPLGYPFKVPLAAGFDVSDLRQMAAEMRAEITGSTPGAIALNIVVRQWPRDTYVKDEFLQEEVTKAFSDKITIILESWQVLGDLQLSVTDILLVELPPPPAGSGSKRKHDSHNRPESMALKRLKTDIAMKPSSLTAPSEFQKIVGEGHAISCNRPFDCHTLPLVLLHEAFTIFKDRCREDPSEQALSCLNQLSVVGCAWFETQVERRSEIQAVLKECMDLSLPESKVPGTDYGTDGNLDVVVMPAAIRDCKNESGPALNEAILYYANFLQKAFDHPLRFRNFRTCFPSILIVDMGSYMGFYGAAWDGRCVKVEPLTPLFDLSTHWKERKARYAMAASLDALVAAISNITAHYRSIVTDATENPQSSEADPRVEKARGYPFLTSYNDGEREITFTYKARVYDTKLFFYATLDGPDAGDCLVKFTPQYSEGAHSYLASRGLAPMLRRCVQISADWVAVIMDISPYKVLCDMDLSEADKEKIRHKVKSALDTLHQGGFVHGDVRDTNLLVDVQSLESEDVAIHLIDFDWAGRIGEAKYPLGINRTSVKRPAGVEGGALIAESHDIGMLSYLFE
ncbi:hypothetical protein OE88DRAFT_1808792 [Heliocybe sulcata]|uniref:Protein kinase domain-containing protein n=1 Tax=Heliocybe sulcata TaxID=5364 RepID=A0A5C3MYR0_9AGAM|nr:hypothetical protein OE88DRAFT_1808792 [Heliocybe sulcata]